MKKKLLSVLLSTSMVAALLVGCNSAAPATPAEPADPADPAEPVVDEPAAPAEDTGATLNIQVWNTEFQSRVVDHYPGYEKVDDMTGKIGDVTVNWTITPSDDNAYQNNLDSLLPNNEGSADPVDIFLVEADYAMKYTSSPYAMALSDIGITDADVADQWQYTKDVVTFDGKLKGSSWQGCPGVLIYNRDVATEVFGTDDPAEVQKKVADWDTFVATAQELKDAGYYACSSANDTYRVYSNNVTSKWVEDGKINIDANIKKWVDDSKAMVDAGYCGTHDLWSDDWSAGFYPAGKVFAYFGPAWLIDFCMAADTEGSIANAGKWAATEGPQGFFWGGTWMCVATGTDNPNLCADLVKTMTTDPAVLKEITVADNDFVNSQTVMAEMAQDTSYGDAVLGGQNALGMFNNGVKTIDLSNLSNYDQGCNEAFQSAMKDYFEGNADYDTALEAFYTAVLEKYPALER